ncbi:hypothetical protein AKO1_006213 [Acrasis kona]|uniref:Prominin-like protein n=1 Tax=Acrasis kona TaxID=1008807 RepID=A0AAW2YI72_9EUKA
MQNSTSHIEEITYASQNQTSELSTKINQADYLLNGYPKAAVDSFEYTIDFFNATVYDLLELEENIRYYLNTSRFHDKVNYAFVAVGVLFVVTLAAVMVCYFVFAIIGTTRVRSVSAMKCSALCSMFSVLWFCLAAAVLVGLTMINISYCKNGRNEMLNPDLLSRDFVISHSNYSKMLNLTYGILKCTEGQSLVDVALRLYPDRNVSFLDPRFNNYTYTALNDINDVVVVTGNVSGVGQDLVDRTNKFYALLQNIQNTFNSDLDDFVKKAVLTPLNNDNLYEIDNSIVFSKFDSLIVDINNVTLPKLDLYYVRDNVSLFNNDVYLNNTRLTPDEINILSGLDSAIRPTTQVYDNVLVLRTQIFDWLTTKARSQTYLNNFQFPILTSSFNRVSEGIKSLVQTTESIRYNLNNVDMVTFQERLFAVTNHTNQFIQETQCHDIGDGARKFESNVCSVVLPSLIVTCVAAFLIAFLLFVVFPLSLVTGKKYASDYSSENVSLLEERSNQIYGDRY